MVTPARMGSRTERNAKLMKLVAGVAEIVSTIFKGPDMKTDPGYGMLVVKRCTQV